MNNTDKVGRSIFTKRGGTLEITKERELNLQEMTERSLQ